MTLEEASQSLWEEFRWKPIFVGVGIQEEKKTLILYLKTKTRNVRVPSMWEGYKVEVRSTGQVRPAESDKN
jgi:hypothetical protein